MAMYGRRGSAATEGTKAPSELAVRFHGIVMLQSHSSTTKSGMNSGLDSSG